MLWPVGLQGGYSTQVPPLRLEQGEALPGSWKVNAGPECWGSPPPTGTCQAAEGRHDLISTPFQASNLIKT